MPIILFRFPGLMADQTGNYMYSFYMTGGALLAAFLTPMMLIAINRRRSTRIHRQNVEVAVIEEGVNLVNGDLNPSTGV